MKVIKIVIFIFIIIIILCTTFLYLLYAYSNSSLSYTLRNSYPLLLLICTLGISSSISASFVIDIFELNYKSGLILKFNIEYILGMACMFSYSYRGLLVYLKYIKNERKLLNKNDNCKISLIRKSFIFIYVIILMYVFIIDVLITKKYLEINEKLFTVYYVIILVYSFAIIPIIIYLLNSIKIFKKIRNQYIFTMLIIIINFGIFMVIDFISIDAEFSIIIKKYWSIIATSLIYAIYNIYPLLESINLQKNHEHEKNIHNINININQIDEFDSKILLLKKFQSLKSDKDIINLVRTNKNIIDELNINIENISKTHLLEFENVLIDNILTDIYKNVAKET